MFDFLSNAASMHNGVGIEIFVQLMDDILNIILESELFLDAVAMFIPVGIALCVAYFCVEMSDRASSVSFNLEIFIRQMLRFIIAYALVSNVDNLILGFNTFVQAINDVFLAPDFFEASNALDSYIQNNNDVIAAGANATSNLGGFAQKINIAIAFCFNITIQFSIISVAVQRAITIAAKTILAPIIVPDIYNNGLNSGGIKFLRGLFADFFQTTVVIFVVEMCCIVAFDSGAGDTGVVLRTMSTVFSGIICFQIVKSSVKNTSDYAQAIMSASVR